MSLVQDTGQIVKSYECHELYLTLQFDEWSDWDTERCFTGASIKQLNELNEQNENAYQLKTPAKSLTQNTRKTAHILVLKVQLKTPPQLSR